MKEHKEAIISSIIIAILTIIITSLTVEWRRIDNTVTQDQFTNMQEKMYEQIDNSNEKILNRAKQYTDDKIEGIKEFQTANYENLENIINANDDKFIVILKQINERLDRIDKRMQ
jgi:uncharacterized membrane protein (DUF106 family)